MVGLRGSIIFPVGRAPGILAGHAEGSGRGFKVFLSKGRMHRKVHGLGSPVQTNPLVPSAHLYVCIVFYAAKRWIENIIIKNVLGIMRLLLANCLQDREAYQYE